MIICAAAAVALALVAAACSDDTAAPASTTSTAPTSTTSTTTTAPTSTEAAVSTEVEVATINLLHGHPVASNCAEETDQCHAPTRIDILWDLLDEQSGCPEIIALQEISPRQQTLVPEKLDQLCDGDHVLLVDDVGSLDQEMILTTLTVLDDRRVELAGAPVWSAHWAQLESPSGLVVDVYATHYASSSFDVACDPAEPITTCSPACPTDALLGDCHPIETLEFLDDNAAPGSLQLVIGDLNKRIDDARIQTLLTDGFVDTHLAAGNAECDPATGDNCTSGIGGDTDLDGLDIADQSPGSRIDFVLARPPAGCDLVVDTDDSDDDGTRTGLWADEPLPEPVDGLYWAADHTGVQADIGLDCG